jgi:hypothetical protein
MPFNIDFRGVKLKIKQKLKKKSFTRLVKLITFFIFIYQTIVLTIDYLKYETVIHWKMMDKFENQEYLPAISLCVDSKYKIFFNESLILDCGTKNTIQMMNDYCRNSTYLAESITPSGKRCLTLFSNLFGVKRKIRPDSNINVAIFHNYNYWNGLVHQNITPPHLYRNFLRLGKSGINSIEYSSVTEQLLPFLFWTNCFEY